MGFAGHLPELVVLLVAALVIFGPKRLPEIGSAMGKSIKEFKKGVDEPAGQVENKDVRLPDPEPARTPEPVGATPVAHEPATERPTQERNAG